MRKRDDVRLLNLIIEEPLPSAGLWSVWGRSAQRNISPHHLPPWRLGGSHGMLDLGHESSMRKRDDVRLLNLIIEEPLPSAGLLPLMAEEHGNEEAARRYRALVLTTLRQLRGLSDTRIRLLPNPADADEAIRFWLLPKLAERWHCDGGVFVADGWEIDFGGNDHAFQVEAFGEILCPFLSARWVHTALLGIERGTHRVTGPAAGGGEYFRAQASAQPEHLTSLEERILPELPVILTCPHWDEALQSPLGSALKRAWEEEV